VPRPFSAETGRISAEVVQGRQLLDEGQQLGLVGEAVDLVDHQQHRRGGRQHAQDFGFATAPVAGLDHQQDDIDIGEAGRDAAVHQSVERVLVRHLEAGRIDEDELRIVGGEDAVDAMARGLRLFRGDADLGADQAVGQRGLADVGPADDSQVAGAKAIAHLPILAMARSAACCSAMRRLAPVPVLRTPSSGTSHSTSNSWAWASPRVASSCSAATAGAGPEGFPARRSWGPCRLRRVDALERGR
jgi:hypothetical protein